MIILPVSQWSEDDGNSLFIRFSRNEKGEIMGEPPEVVFANGYIEHGFNIEEWDYFLKGSINSWFEQAEQFGDKMGF